MVSWDLFMPDGRIISGQGQDAPAGMKLADIAKDALHGRFHHAAGTTIYVAGAVELFWTVQRVAVYGPEARKARLPVHTKALGLVPKGCQLFLMPDGSVGIGRTVEQVAQAFRAFATGSVV